MTSSTSGRAAARGERDGTGPGRRGGRRLRRGSLTPEVIVAESLRLLDAQGADGFSLPKLGRALGADPTAVYRHFASKDDLVLAIADRLIEEAMTGLSARPCWADTVAEVVRRLRATYRAHPGAASLSASRTTQRPAEMRVVNVLIGAVLQAGFEGAAAARVYRALGDFALAWAGGEAAFLALDPGLQQADRAAWARAYLAVDQAEYPHIWQIRDDLASVTDDDIFEMILSLVVDGFLARAPRPCTCAKHVSPDTATASAT
ncbi:MAG TPA: TetR/AcrR family transcriptional regulator [Streptosporangiaceae bacterium]|nr:TetR/AcrR family transcriptional regulator [Streptosporangiaceae bacterium]